MKEILTELYQLLFISSLVYLLYIITGLAVKAYGFFKLKNEDVKYTLTNKEKIILWISISIFLSYLIK